MAANAPVSPISAASQAVPDWLRRLTSISWRLIVIFALATVIILVSAQLWTITASILVAAIVAATFSPAVLWLRSRGRSRAAAAALVMVAVAVIVGGALLLIALSLAPAAGDIATRVTSALDALRQRLDEVAIPSEVGASIEDIGAGVAAWLQAAVGDIVAAVADVATIAVLATFLTFFFLMDGDRAWGWALQVTSDWQREEISTAGDDALSRVGGYLRGTAILAAIKASSDFVFLTLLGIPYAAPLAVLVFMGGFIPYVGGFVTTTILVLVTWSTGGITSVVILLALIAVMNIILGDVLGPLLYRRTISIHPAIVLVALPAGMALAGIIGLFAVLPILAFVTAIAGAIRVALEGQEPDNGPVPRWLDRLAQWSWRLLIVIGVAGAMIFIAVQIPTVVAIVALGLVLASMLLPGARALERRGWGRTRATAAVWAGFWLAAIAVVVVTIVALARPLADIVDQAVAGAGQIGDPGGGTLESVVGEFGGGLVSAAVGLVQNLASFAVILFLAALVSFYLVRDGSAGWARITRGLPEWRREGMGAIGARSVDVLGSYMLGTAAISAFAAVTQWLILVILGIPLAGPLAVLAFVGGFIPYIGSFVATAAAFLVTVALGDPTDVAIMAVYTIVFNIIQGNFVAPLVYSRAVNLHPAVVLVAIPAGAQIAGIMGMFLAVPVIGVVAAVWRPLLAVAGGAVPTLGPASATAAMAEEVSSNDGEVSSGERRVRPDHGKVGSDDGAAEEA